MSFTRKAVNEVLTKGAVEMPKEVLDQLFELHTTSMKDLSNEKEELEAKVVDLETKAKQTPPKTPEGTEGGKTPEGTGEDDKAAKIQKEFEDFKKQVEDEKNSAKINELKTSKLKEAGFSESVIDLLLNDKAFEKVSLNDKGEISGVDEGVTALKESRASLLVTELSKSGTSTATGNKNEGGESDPFLEGFNSK